MEKIKNRSPETSERKELIGCVLSCKKKLWSIDFISVMINIFIKLCEIFNCRANACIPTNER